MTALLTTSKRLAARTVDPDLLSLPGDKLLQRILDSDNPGELVQSLPAEDLFWIIKRIGAEDCLALLEVASEEQWQYLVDLDVWRKDLLSPEKALAWLKILAEANPEQLSAWLFGEEQTFLSLLLFRMAEVIIKDEDDNTDLPNTWFTLDGRFYIKAFHEEDQETIEELLSLLGKNDHEEYQELLFGLAALSPTEAEEELYRLRNNRIAEHGFLPFAEAIAVYAPLAVSALDAETLPLAPGKLFDQSENELIPTLPLLQVAKESLLSLSFSRISDPLLFDRISLEFADLSNRIIAAGNFPELSDPDVLAASCKQAAGYLNIVLERLCGKDSAAAENLLRKHSLLTLFRTGYGFAVSLQREAKLWWQESWFFGQGWKNEFWGSPWGDTLDGLLLERPRFFAGDKNNEPFKEFASMEELDDAREQLRMMQALDRMLARLSPVGRDDQFRLAERKDVHSLLFTRWAHKILDGGQSFAPLSRSDAGRFFHSLRQGEEHPPYRMLSYKNLFINAFLEGAPDFEPDAANALHAALELIWEEFSEEYKNIAENDLEGRYSPFLLIAL
ncbi:MAG: DUF6178 family protein [Syntrophales bacterium]